MKLVRRLADPNKFCDCNFEWNQTFQQILYTARKGGGKNFLRALFFWEGALVLGVLPVVGRARTGWSREDALRLRGMDRPRQRACAESELSPSPS